MSCCFCEQAATAMVHCEGGQHVSDTAGGLCWTRTSKVQATMMFVVKKHGTFDQASVRVVLSWLLVVVDDGPSDLFDPCADAITRVRCYSTEIVCKRPKKNCNHHATDTKQKKRSKTKHATQATQHKERHSLEADAIWKQKIRPENKGWQK